MVRISCILLFLSFANGISAQNYVVGTPVNDTLCQFSYGSPGNCEFDSFGDFDVNISAYDINQWYDISGVNVELHVLEVNVSGGNVIDQLSGQEMIPGMILPFEETSSSYTLLFSAAGSITYAVIASGTPTQVCETFPCNRSYVIITLAECGNGMVFPENLENGYCSVLHPESTQEETACESYYWVSADETFTTSGIYTDTLQAVEGCDSIVHIDLTIHNLNTNVTTNEVGGNIVLEAEEAGLAYQWIDCLDGNAPIVNEINQSFTPTENGSYAVQITENGCTFESACVVVDVLGIVLSEHADIVIFPNPNHGKFTLKNETQQPLELMVIDGLGKTVFVQTIQGEETNISVDVEPDVYTVRIVQNGTVMNRKMVVR